MQVKRPNMYQTMQKLFNGRMIRLAVLYGTLSLLLAACSSGGGSNGSSGSSSNAKTDTMPDPLVFTEQKDRDISTWVVSESLLVSGLDASVRVTVSGGEYAIDDGEFSLEPGLIGNGQSIQLRQRTAQNALTLAETTITVGDASSTFRTTTLDAQYPIASITFPPMQSFTDAKNIIVRGKTVDRQGNTIVDVRVNGKTVTTLDNFTNWEIQLELAAGENPIVIETSDEQGEQGPETELANVYSSTAMLRSRRLIMDPTNNAIYTLEAGFGAVVKFNLANGSRSILSGKGVPDDVSLIPSPQGFALDAANNRLLLVNTRSNLLLAVDVNTGARTVVSGDTALNSEYAFEQPVNVVLDKNSNRALVADDGLDAILAVDLTTGQRSILSDATTPDAQNPLVRPRNIILDAVANRLLSMEFTSSVLMAIDLISGKRSVISDVTIPNALNILERAQDMVLDAANNRVLVVDSILRSLLAIDLATGERTVLSSNTKDSGNVMFVEPAGITLDADNNRALVMDRGSDSLLAVSLDSGERHLLSVGGQPRINRDHLLMKPAELLFDETEQRILLADVDVEALFAIDTNNGQRTIISDNTSAGPKWVAPRGLLKGNAATDVWVVDSAIDTIFNVNLLNGERSIITDGDRSINNGELKRPLSIAQGSDAQSLVVADIFLSSIVTVGLGTGERSVFSNNQSPDQLNPFCCISSVIYDAQNTRFLVTTLRGDIITVDEASGTRTVLSTSLDAEQGPAMNDPVAMAIDDKNNQLYVVDEALNALFKVDLSTGARTIVSHSNTPNSANGFSKPYGLALDIKNNRAFVTSVNTVNDEDLGMVIAVDLTNGQRVVLSR